MNLDRILGGAYSKAEGGMTQKKMLGQTQKKMLGKTQDMEGGLMGGVLGGLLGGMKQDKLQMLGEMSKMTDEELEGNGFYTAIGRGMMRKLRPHLKGGMMGGMLGGMLGGVLGGAKQEDVEVKEVMETLPSKQPKQPKQPKKKRVMTDRMKKRGELVKKLMKEEGMTLGQASRHIKEKNLM